MSDTLGTMARALGWLLCAALATTSAAAQTPAEKAQAQVLFEEGRKLLEAGNLGPACDKLAASLRLDPAIGTQLNLARCFELSGKTASAWVNYLEVASHARTAGQEKRADFAAGKAEELKPLLSKLRVDVTSPVADLEVRVGESVIAEKAWGSELPFDPGDYDLVASAPNKKPWTTHVKVGAQADSVKVSVPALEPAPVEPGGDVAVVEPTASSGPSTQWILGWVTGAVGLGGIGAGIGLRVVALAKDDDSLAFCNADDPTLCSAEGVDLRDEAIALQTGSVVAWAAGGALLVTGVVLLVTAPSDEPEAALAPMVGPDGGGLGLRGRF
jgi:hypothetical protein